MSILTVSDFIASRYTLTVYCQNCDHTAAVDLQALADAGRGDAVLVGAERVPFRCGKCGSAKTGRTVQPPTGGHRYG